MHEKNKNTGVIPHQGQEVKRSNSTDQNLREFANLVVAKYLNSILPSCLEEIEEVLVGYNPNHPKTGKKAWGILTLTRNDLLIENVSAFHALCSAELEVFSEPLFGLGLEQLFSGVSGDLSLKFSIESKSRLDLSLSTEEIFGLFMPDYTLVMRAEPMRKFLPFGPHQ